MSFPSNPYCGQLHIDDAALWRFDGEVWTQISSHLSDINPICDDDVIPEPPPPTSGSTDEILLRIEQHLIRIEAKLTNGFLLID